ncbi:MAG: putative porin [Endomicrobiales bacterium]|nr:putative porin [Endomicrobiales bacterium]
MKRISVLSIFMMLLFSIAQAGEIDKLVQHLMKEGVIKPADAQLILTETKEDNRVKMAQGELDTLPSWIQTMKIGGDLRFRYQNEDKGTYRRERTRIRFRLKGEASSVQGWKVGWGLATGGEDPRSTNQTLDAGFETKRLMLDYAYGAYSGLKGLTVNMGKIPVKSAITLYSDLMWDGDIAVEGLSAYYESNPGNLQFFANVDYLIMDYVDNGNDPSMVLVQPGVVAKIGENAKLKLSVGQYALSGEENAPIFAASSGGSGNTLSGGKYVYSYNCMTTGFKLSFSNLHFEEVSLFGDYVSNPDPSEANTGTLFGIVFGNKKVSSSGQWQVKALQRNLGADAWMDWLPDSDARSGKTDTAGPEVIFTYGVAKNITFGIDYYINGEAEEEAGDEKHDLAQFDLIYKF